LPFASVRTENHFLYRERERKKERKKEMSHSNATHDAIIEDENDDGDDDITIIYLDDENETANILNSGNNNATTATASDDHGIFFDWIQRSDGTILQDERRRAILIQELQRVQRTSCIQFSILCLLPVLLFAAMAIAVLRQDESCESTITECALEPRTFANAFTTRCICQPIPVANDGPP
jgi:hypothetical protein